MAAKSAANGHFELAPTFSVQTAEMRIAPVHYDVRDGLNASQPAGGRSNYLPFRES
jgi:hypothetical protein